MVKVIIEVELPDYEVKYCDDIWHGQCCKFLQKYGYGFKQICILSGKDITKTKDNGNRICRPYGCRCLIKNKTN
jgi:hypothetical protein